MQSGNILQFHQTLMKDIDESLHLGKNHLTQRLLYNKALNISCNLLNRELKVKNGMVVWLEEYGLLILVTVWLAGSCGGCQRPAT